MSLEQILSTVWRRKLLFIVVFALGVAAIAAVTFSLPKTYRASATVFVGVNEEANEALAFDSALGERLVRTYTALAANPNTADAVARELEPQPTREALLGRMSFAPVERTSLLEISADAESPEEAQEIANTYAQVFKERVDTDLLRGETQTELAVSEPAALPRNPVRPKPPLYMGIGTVLAGLLAVGLVLLRERIADPLLINEEESTVMGLPILGRIPQVDWRRPTARAQVSDALELLRANVDFAAEGDGAVLLVTSARPVEGKSTLSVELAARCAANGEEVVVVEADLRRPGIGQTPMANELKHATMGLSNYLVQGATLEQMIPEMTANGVRVIWSGPIPPNPTALIQSDRFDELLRELTRRFDRVIVDSPPISVGADASLLAPRADYVLYVIDSSNARRRPAQVGLNQLEATKSQSVGVVLNRVAQGEASAYGYYYSAGEPPEMMPALTGTDLDTSVSGSSNGPSSLPSPRRERKEAAAGRRRQSRRARRSRRNR